MVGKKMDKGDKKGSMLLLVLIILAVGLILISSAMMMTSQTRKRFYSYSESSQARLTVTSAAETFWQALYLQEITDEQLTALANARATVDLGGTNIAGLSDSADNTTTVSFSTGTVSGVNYVYADFATTIDAETENVRVTLKAPTTHKKVTLFSSPVELKGGLTTATQFNYNTQQFGKSGSGWKSDNWLYFYGNSSFDNGGSHVYGNVFCEGTIKFGNSDYINGDLVLYGASSGITGRSGSALQNSTNANIYFINSNNPINTSWNANDVQVSGMAFQNTGAVSSQMTQVIKNTTSISNVYNSDSTNELNYGMVNTLQAQANTYSTEDFNTSVHQSLETNYPDAGLSASAASELFGVSVTVPSDAINIPIPNDNNSTHEVELEANTSYKMSGEIGGNSGSYVNCDLSKGNYYVYVTGNTNCRIQFRCKNGTGTSNNLYIILAPNARLTFAKANGAFYSGVVSTTHSGDFTNASSFYSTLKENNKPHCFIYGYDNSTVECPGQNFVEAYVGMYGKGGNVTFGESTNVGFYGRIASTSLTTGGGGNIEIPYCPDPNYDENPSDELLPHFSGFTVENFQYYYVA